MQSLAYDYYAVYSAQQRTTTVKTTLYELIETIHEVIPQGDDRLIPEIVLDLIVSGRMRFLTSLRECALSGEALKVAQRFGE